MKTIHGFTEFRLTNSKNYSIIRACPAFRNENHWFDWVKIEWESEGILEGQCLLFLDFKSIELENFDMSKVTYEGMNQPHKPLAYGNAVLIHSTQYNESETCIRECLSRSRKTKDDIDYIRNRLVKFCKMEDNYQIIDTDCLQSVCFVIPYEYKDSNQTYLPGYCTRVMILCPMCHWNKFFIDYDDINLMNIARKRKNKSIKTNDERYPFEG